MKACHDFDSVVIEGSLAAIGKRYSISEEYVLYAPLPEQRPYNSSSSELSILGGPNSWRYLVAFLGECCGAGIIPSHNLFMACFRLCKSQGVYYLTARAGFKVSGAPTNNKGWKTRYLFVSGPNSGFRLDWSVHPISIVPPYLSEEEPTLVSRLKGILSFSRVIRDMIELWLVEAGLSPAPRGAMDFSALRGVPKVSAGKSAPATRATTSLLEVKEVYADTASRTAVTSPLKRPTEKSTLHQEDPA
ncbi:hypothetical protein B296_00001773 [Ensete ventricosum]|uniref:Uncharacterized protein n=1 Tax=Ensete ventricosum TaxID=4639 RepID=A0A427BAA1_ENSVE|nr:hypothetical protein B296_00001773 [Ensete ventricosum]